MPCMGPNMNEAYERGQEYTEEILKLLRKKGVSRPNPLVALPAFVREWDDLEAQLRKIIKKMVWTEESANF